MTVGVVHLEVGDVLLGSELGNSEHRLKVRTVSKHGDKFFIDAEGFGGFLVTALRTFKIERDVPEGYLPGTVLLVAGCETYLRTDEGWVGIAGHPVSTVTDESARRWAESEDYPRDKILFDPSVD